MCSRLVTRGRGKQGLQGWVSLLPSRGRLYCEMPQLGLWTRNWGSSYSPPGRWAGEQGRNAMLMVQCPRQLLCPSREGWGQGRAFPRQRDLHSHYGAWEKGAPGQRLKFFLPHGMPGTHSTSRDCCQCWAGTRGAAGAESRQSQEPGRANPRPAHPGSVSLSLLPAHAFCPEEAEPAGWLSGVKDTPSFKT